MTEKPGDAPSRRSGSLSVGAGILLSRLLGLVRERVFAHYFGNSAVADAFKAALRIPNVLQNLFGEGVLSGSFIPVYAGLLAQGKKEEAGRVAGIIAGLLSIFVSVIVALGVSFSDVLVDVIAPGFADEKRSLTITLTRIFFPGVGLLVLSAWCLGILNSHRKFFLSYAAPVAWNLVIIASLLWFGQSRAGDELAILVAWGVVLGSAAQLLVQLPSVFSLTGKIPFSLDLGLDSAKTVIKNFIPVLFGRGIVQLSAYADSLIASLLPTGAVAALMYSQTIYLLPIGLFGMSVSASELPAMSQLVGEDSEIFERLRDRLKRGLEQILFFIIPSSVALIVIGDVFVAGVFETGKFGPNDTHLVWEVLAALSLGLAVATMGRLYASTFYALKDTRTPLRCALVRVAVSVTLGMLGALFLPAYLGLPPMSGLMLLALASALGSYVEFSLLKRALSRRIGFKFPIAPMAYRPLLAALTIALLLRLLAPELASLDRFLLAAMLGFIFGISYLGLCFLLKVPQATRVIFALRRK